MDHKSASGNTLKIAAALGVIYLVWGSTYLAIRFAVETIPPYLMSGCRFLVAGAILYLFARYKGAESPQKQHWIGATLVSSLLLLIGNGSVSWAEQRVPSGITALLIATVPLWMVLLDWLWHKGPRPIFRVIIGVILGFIGTGLLVSQGGIGQANEIDPIGAIVLIFAALAWAVGSLYSRRATLPKSPLLDTAMQMLTGGVMLLLAGFALGEASRVDVNAITFLSLVSWFHLVIFGAIVAFSCYTWLLRTAPAALVSTYAYVNPVIAVFLGWAAAGEIITRQTLLASAIIIVAVILITLPKKKPSLQFKKQPLQKLPEALPLVECETVRKN